MKVIERLEQYIKKKKLSLNSIDIALKMGNGYIGKQIKNKASIGADVIQKIVSIFPDLDLEWLVTGEGDMLKTAESAKKELLPAYGRKRQKDQMNIVPIIDIKAAANYSSGYMVDGYIETLDKMMLPTSLIGYKKHFLFQNKGESMHPTLYDSDYVVATFVEKSEWGHIPDNFIYVIVTYSRGINIKRIKKSSKDKKFFFRCKSDNRTHPPFNAEIEDVLEIWKVACKLSFNLPNENENIYNKLGVLEDRVDDIEQTVKAIK